MIAHVCLKQNIILKSSKKLKNISRPFASVLFLHHVFIVRELYCGLFTCCELPCARSIHYYRNWEPIDAINLGYYDFTVHKYVQTFVRSLQGGFKSVDMNPFPPPPPPP